MATPLKHSFNHATVDAIAAQLAPHVPGFRSAAFRNACKDGLEGMELTARARHVCNVMSVHLPADRGMALRQLGASLGPELTSTTEFGMAPFLYLPHVYFVAEHGLDHFDDAMAFQHAVTRRFTAEFSIRAYLEKHPARTLRVLGRWARDENPHVRRLVSEGTRPRLPWAARLPAFQRDPAPVLDLLEMLRDDPEEYVRRSVANNLNDISKDNPSIAVDVCRRWMKDAPAPRAALVRHALRSLVKAGDPGALDVMGVGRAARVVVEKAVFSPARPRVGDTVVFTFSMRSTARTEQDVLVDFRVHFVKADGHSSPRVFKLTRLQLAGGDVATLTGRIRLQTLSTRRPYPGVHAVEAMVNGVAYPLGDFRLRG